MHLTENSEISNSRLLHTQISGRSPDDWFLNPGDILGCWNCYRRPREWGTCCPTIFTSVMSVKVLDEPKNLTPVWKCVEIQLPAVSCSNSLEILSFVICLHTKDRFSIIPGILYLITYNKMLTISQQESGKWKRIKSIEKNWFVVTIMLPSRLGL